MHDSAQVVFGYADSALPPGGLPQRRGEILPFPGSVDVAAADLTVRGERPIELAATLLR